MAVYTHVTATMLQEFLIPYRIGELQSFSGIAEGVENSNYLLTLTTGAYILTLFEKRVREEDVPFFLALTEHLAGRGVPCPKPVRRPDGNALGTLAERPAAIVGFLPGRSVLQPAAPDCTALGALLADLHRAGADFPLRRANTVNAASWMKLLTAGSDGGDLARRARVQCGAALAAWPTDLPAGIIHADLFPNNVLFDGGKLCGVIDFYFACHDFLAYDLAICINAWCADQAGCIDDARARALLRAYHARRALTAAEIDAMSVLLQGAALRFLATRQYDWVHWQEGALVTPHDPAEYARILDFHIAHPAAVRKWLP